MRITLSLDDKLLKAVRKIAVGKGTTVNGLVREYLEELAANNAALGRKRLAVEALEHSFQQLQIRVGKQTWRRDDLYHRPQADQ